MVDDIGVVTYCDFMDTTDRNFGDVVRAYRKARGLSRQDLADRVDGRGESSGAWLNGIERHGQLPRPRRLTRLLEVIRGVGPALPDMEQALAECQGHVELALEVTIRAEADRRARQASRCVIRTYERFLPIPLDSPTPNE